MESDGKLALGRWNQVGEEEREGCIKGEQREKKVSKNKSVYVRVCVEINGDIGTQNWKIQNSYNWVKICLVRGINYILMCSHAFTQASIGFLEAGVFDYALVLSIF